MKQVKSLTEIQNTVEKYNNDKPKLLRALKQMIREGQRTGDVLLVGAAYYRSAIVYYELGDLDRLLSDALKAAALLRETDEHELYAKAYIALGYVYGEQENHQMSLAACDAAQQIVKRHRIRGRTRMIALNNLATCYHTLGDRKTSIRLLNECIALLEADAPKDYSNLLMFMLNLSDSYRDDGAKEKAAQILAQATAWLDEAGDDPIVCDYYLRQAILSYELGDPEAGSRCVDEALSRIPQDCYPVPLYDDLRKVSALLLQHGDREREERIFARMTEYAEKNKSTLEQLIAMRALADHFKGVGETQLALEYFARADALHEERLRELTLMQLNVYRQRKEADAEILRLKKKMRKNEEMISLEPMTKLLNRAALLRVAEEFIEAARKKKKKIGAIFLDIDFFKECNDTYGHARGDEIIREVARACQKEESANVRFARYGGDEFFGLTRGLADAEVLEIARRICRRIRRANIPNEKNPNGQRVTLSVGVLNVTITEHTDTIIEIANYADKALYYAKSAGKNAIYQLERDDVTNRSEYIRIDFTPEAPFVHPSLSADISGF